MKIIVEIKLKPDSHGMCECRKVEISEDEILVLATTKAAKNGINPKQMFDSEIECIKL